MELLCASLLKTLPILRVMQLLAVTIALDVSLNCRSQMLLLYLQVS